MDNLVGLPKPFICVEYISSSASPHAEQKGNVKKDPSFITVDSWARVWAEKTFFHSFLRKTTTLKMVNACSAPRFMLPTASPAYNFRSAFLCCRRQVITVDTWFFAPRFHTQMVPAILWFWTEVSIVISTSPNRAPKITSFCRTHCLWSSTSLNSHADCLVHSYTAATCGLISLNLSVL